MRNGYKLYVYPWLSHIQMFRDTCMNMGRTFLNVELHSGSPFPYSSRRPLLQIHVIQIEVVDGVDFE